MNRNAERGIPNPEESKTEQEVRISELNQELAKIQPDLSKPGHIISVERATTLAKQLAKLPKIEENRDFKASLLDEIEKSISQFPTGKEDTINNDAKKKVLELVALLKTG